jgi:UDP-N-acetylglucosamine--N-acetylmuramyl-(pentapeptide) pyrophosphoryl-undecaprenol N-acetylglucosamine transferase
VENLRLAAGYLKYMRENKIKIIVSGGGTAGHVTPLLSISEEISRQSPDVIIRFVGQRSDFRSRSLVEKCSAIDKSYLITTGKLRRFHGRGLVWYIMHPTIMFHNVVDVFKLFVGMVQSLIILIKWRPAVVFIKGGFVGLPVGLAAAFLRIKIVTHDSDAVPGLTNRILSKFASVSAVSLPVKYYKKYYNLTKMVQTGVPINQKFFEKKLSVQALKENLNIPTGSRVLCIIGGSLGAVRMNNAVINILPMLLKNQPELKVIWSTGEHQYNDLKKAIRSLGLSSQVIIQPFFNNIDEIFRVADLVISRAGATTIAELAALEKACIFIPNPILTGGHQTKNALVLEQNKAAAIISEQQLEKNSDYLLKTVTNLLKSPEQQKSLANNLSKFADSQATAKLAKIIIKAAKI